MIQLATKGKFPGRSVEVSTWGKFRTTWGAKIVTYVRTFISTSRMYYFNTKQIEYYFTSKLRDYYFNTMNKDYHFTSNTKKYFFESIRNILNFITKTHNRGE